MGRIGRYLKRLHLQQSNWLTIDRRENINTLDQLSRDDIVARLADLQKKYPQAFVIEGQMKDVTNGKRSRIKSLAKDKEALSAQMSPNKD